MAGPTRKRDAIREGAAKHIAETPQPGHGRDTSDPQPGHSGPTPIRKVRIPEDQWAAIAEYASRHGISTSAAVRVALGEFLRARG